MQTSKTISVQQLRINIGSKQRNVRGVMGLVVLGFSVPLLLQIIRDELTFWSGLSLFVLLQTGIMLLMEWKMRVCPVNAVRGRQSMTGWFSIGKEQVRNQEKLKEARKPFGIPAPIFRMLGGNILGNMLLTDMIISNEKMKNQLDVDLKYPTYREGISALVDKYRCDFN